MPIIKNRLFFIILLLSSASAFSSPNIVVSIKPIHSIVSLLTQGITTPTLLLTSRASAHHAHLKPSQLSALSRADLAIFIHPNFEAGLGKVLNNLDADKKMTIADLQGIHLIQSTSDHKADNDGVWQAIKRFFGGNDTPPEEHEEHENINYHLWLDIDNMQIFAQALSHKLRQMDAENAELYQHNLTTTLDKLKTLKTTLWQQLSRHKNHPIATFSNATAYFMRSNHLQNPVIITQYHGDRLSIKKIRRSKQAIKEARIHCLISTLEIPQKRIDTLTENLNIRTKSVDIIGFDIAPNQAHYFTLMGNLARKVNQCLP